VASLTNFELAITNSPKSQKKEKTKKERVSERLEASLMELVKALKMPAQCLTIAQVYINRVLANIMINKFFPSSSTIEK